MWQEYWSDRGDRRAGGNHQSHLNTTHETLCWEALQELGRSWLALPGMAGPWAQLCTPSQSLMRCACDQSLEVLEPGVFEVGLLSVAPPPMLPYGPVLAKKFENEAKLRAGKGAQGAPLPERRPVAASRGHRRSERHRTGCQCLSPRGFASKSLLLRFSLRAGC